MLCVQELVEGPLGKLYHYVVQRGLEACVRLARHIVAYLVQGVAEGDFCCNLGNGVSGCL